MATVASPRELHPVQSANILIQYPDRTSRDPSLRPSAYLSDATPTPSQPRNPMTFPTRQRSQRFRPSLHSRDGDATTSHAASTEEEQAPIPWGPAHPDFPHRNPHVPLSSPLYESTRIIRIPRSYEAVGDLAPTFDDTYPHGVLQPHISQSDFYGLIEGLNERLIDAFRPTGARNVLDAVLGVVTLWAWEDLGLSRVKGRLRAVEAWIEEWNRSKGEAGKYRVLSLRRTGYMSLDIEIPDPEIKAEHDVGEEGVNTEGGE